jgi:hypothetical protein
MNMFVKYNGVVDRVCNHLKSRNEKFRQLQDDEHKLVMLRESAKQMLNTQMLDLEPDIKILISSIEKRLIMISATINMIVEDFLDELRVIRHTNK